MERSLLCFMYLNFAFEWELDLWVTEMWNTWHISASVWISVFMFIHLQRTLYCYYCHCFLRTWNRWFLSVTNVLQIRVCRISMCWHWRGALQKDSLVFIFQSGWLFSTTKATLIVQKCLCWRGWPVCVCLRVCLRVCVTPVRLVTSLVTHNCVSLCDSF